MIQNNLISFNTKLLFILLFPILGISTFSNELVYGDTAVLVNQTTQNIFDNGNNDICDGNGNMSSSTVTNWLNGLLYTIDTSYRDCERQTSQWSLTDIPNNAIITDVDYSFTISDVFNGQTCSVYPLTYDVSTATLSELFVDARDGTPYISNDLDCLTTGSKLYDLGPTADSTVQTALTTTDLFGMGFTYYDETLSSVGRATTTNSSGTLIVTYTIPSSITINDVSITEGNSGTRSATFTITRSDNTNPISVQYKTTDNTATSSDYTAIPLTTLNFPAGGSLTNTVTVSVKGDTAIELSETFFVDLSNCTGCIISDSQGIGTIANNDFPTFITIDDVSITEGNSGTKSATFTITRSDNTNPISVNYKTTDNTATSSDYTAISLTTLNFPAGGSLTNTVTVSVKGDTAIETDETFFVDLSNCAGCIISDSQGIGTIASDELPTTITINDVSITEGNSGTKSATFTVTRSDNLKSISVNYKTTDNTAFSSDYTAISPNILSFSAVGSLSKTVTVPVKGDTVIETDETFFVDLSNCVDCIISDSQGLGTIIDNDQPVTPSDITINDITVTEGNSGTKSATFTVSRNTSTSSASVQYKTTDNTATSSDYTAISLTTLSFPVGSLSKTVTVPVKGDTAVETDETFFVDLSNCTGCNLVDSQGIGTITNNDFPTPTITINDVSITEGNSGTRSATFTVTRSNNIDPISVKYETTDGTASYSFFDYMSISRTTLNFPAGGSLTDTITVTVNSNNTLEPNETFFVDLSRCTGCDIIDSQGIGTIINDDNSFPPPTHSSKPIVTALIRDDVPNQQTLVNMFKKYTNQNDHKFAIGAPSRSLYNQLDVHNIAFGLSLERVLLQSQTQQGESTYLGYDPEWFEGQDNTTPEAEYRDYVNSVRTASGYAHDNGFKFLLTPLYVDIQNHAREFAPYVDVVALQIPHYIDDYYIAVQTAVQDIKSVNPDAIVLVQLIPKDGSIKQNTDPAVIIDAYNSVREHVDGVLIYYYESPDPVPILEEFYQGIGMSPIQ